MYVLLFANASTSGRRSHGRTHRQPSARRVAAIFPGRKRRHLHQRRSQAASALTCARHACRLFALWQIEHAPGMAATQRALPSSPANGARRFTRHPTSRPARRSATRRTTPTLHQRLMGDQGCRLIALARCAATPRAGGGTGCAPARPRPPRYSLTCTPFQNATRPLMLAAASLGSE